MPGLCADQGEMGLRKVLIVERVNATARAMERRLRRAGFDTRAVDNAGAASTVVFGMRPDLIILDIDTSRYSGIDFHEYLLTTTRGRRIPVLYLTRHDTLGSLLGTAQSEPTRHHSHTRKALNATGWNPR